MSTRQKDFGILKMLSGRYVAKKSKITKSRVLNEASLTLIWVGFSGVCFAVEGGEGGGGKITPCQKLVRITL